MELYKQKMAYQLVSNVSLPTFELTYGRQKIGLLDAWKQNCLYIGPSTTSTSSTSSGFGSWFRGSSSSRPSNEYPPPPPCSNCGGKTGCVQCQKHGGKSRRCRRRRRLSTRRRRSN